MSYSFTNLLTACGCPQTDLETTGYHSSPRYFVQKPGFDIEKTPPKSVIFPSIFNPIVSYSFTNLLTACMWVLILKLYIKQNTRKIQKRSMDTGMNTGGQDFFDCGDVQKKSLTFWVFLRKSILSLYFVLLSLILVVQRQTRTL